MKKIVIAIDSYKECMEGIDVAKNIQKGMEQELKANYKSFGIADGGEGTTTSLTTATSGTIETIESVDGLNRPIKSFIGFNSDKSIAFMEMAASSGIELIAEQDRNPLITNTYGTGLMIKQAINHGAKHLIIGIGGSVTNDVGIGMLSALGVIFKDKDNNILEPISKNLINIATIDTTQIIDTTNLTIEVACDVTNPLHGPNGATHVYGKQKGATPQMIDELEAGVIHFSKILDNHFNTNSNQIVGGGAAGGLGTALNLFLNATLKPGFEIVENLLNLEQEIKNADLVITGEGRMDSQSINGKGPIGVARLANKYNKPCIAICGSLGQDIEITYKHGITAAYSTMLTAQDLQSAIKDTETNLQLTARAIAKTINITI